MQFENQLRIDEDPLSLRRPAILAIASRMRHRGIGILPMETVYVLCGMADDASVFQRMNALRASQATTKPRPFSFIVSGLPELKKWTIPLSREFLRFLGQVLPGPLTVVLPAGDDTPDWMCDGKRRISIRVPQHPLALVLARELEHPIAVARAAVKNQDGAHTISELPTEWSAEIDFIWDGGKAPMGRHSTVIEWRPDRLRLLREGAYPFTELERYANGEGFQFDWGAEEMEVDTIDPLRVLFVCTGNTCRSVMGEYLLRAKVAAEAPQMIVTASAGTHASGKTSAMPQAVSVLSELMINASMHHSQRITTELLESFDVILTMAQEHTPIVKSLLPIDSSNLVERITDVDNSAPGRDIPDPYGFDPEVYRTIRDQIADELDRIFPKLLKRAKNKQERIANAD